MPLVPAVVFLAIVTTIGYLAQWYSHWDLVTIQQSDVYIFRGAGELIHNGQPLYDHEFWAGYWTYPPFGGLVMTPLSLIPLSWLFPVWTTLSLTALVAVVTLSFSDLIERTHRGPERIFLTAGLAVVAVAVTPVSNALGMGQLGIIITAMCLFDAVILLQRRSRWTGLLVGLTTAVKLTPGLFIVYFLLRQQWREAATSIATVLGCWTLAGLLAWSDTRTYFEDWLIFRTASQIAMDGIEWMNQSIFGMTDRLADGAGHLALFLALSIVTAVVGMSQAVRLGNEGKLLPAATLVGLTSVLCSPVAWLHHGIWVVPALGVIVGAGRSRVRVVTTIALLVGLGVPAAAAQAITGITDWFVLLYVVLGSAVIVVSGNGGSATSGRGHHALSQPSSEKVLNAAPEEYFREAYNPVMYSGAIGVYSKMVHCLMERRLPTQHMPVILELGAGTGQHLRYVKSSYDIYYETDISIDHASTDRLGERSQVVRTFANAEDLRDFGDETVDRVIATCLLAHLGNPEQALQEWRRVLRPGGMATIYVAAEPGMLLRLLRKYLVVPKARRLGQDHLAIIYRDHRNHYPAMRTMIESVFTADDVTRIGFPLRWLGWNLRLFDIFYVHKSPDSADVAAQAMSRAVNRST